MIPEYQESIAARLSREQREKIESLIREGKYSSISQVIREALMSFLPAHE